MTSQDVILGLLHSRPMSGYEIKGMIEMPISMFFDASYGTIYPTLAKLESAGYITKESVVQDNRPNKNVYSLTEAGRARFQGYMLSPLEKDSYRSDFMVRLFFGSYVDRDKLVEWIRREIELSREAAAYLAEIKSNSASIPAPKLISVELGIELSRTRERVLEEGLARLQAEAT